MSKPIKISIAVGIIVLLVFCGWYIFRVRDCINGINYSPAKEQKTTNWSSDKGDYYTHRGIYGDKFKTFEDAKSACMWK